MPTRIYPKTFDRCDGIEISLLDSGWLDRHQLVDEAIELLEKIVGHLSQTSTLAGENWHPLTNHIA